MSDSEQETLAAQDFEDEDIEFRDAKISDLAPIRVFLEHHDPVKHEDAFYKRLLESMREGGGRMACVCAIRKHHTEGGGGSDADAGAGEGGKKKGKQGAAPSASREELVGVIVTQSVKLSEERESGRMAFDLLEKMDAECKCVHVAVCVVAPHARRRGIGTDLMHEGVSRLGVDPEVNACLTYTVVGDKPASKFVKGLYFTKMGVLKDHFTIDGTRHDAYVWGNALRDCALAVYRRRDGEPVDLSAPDAATHRVRPMPRWARDLLLHYVAPIVAVSVLFFICYLLVILGPLRGISGDAPSGAQPAHASAHSRSGWSPLGPDGIATGADEHFQEEL